MKHDHEMLDIIANLRKNRVFAGLCKDCPDVCKQLTKEASYLRCTLDNYRLRTDDQVCQIDRVVEEDNMESDLELAEACPL